MDILTQATHQAAAKALSDARINLLTNKPFYGALAMRLQLQPMPNMPWLMAVDGRHLAYNPDKVVQVPLDKLIGVVEHEVLHLALNHHTRRGGRDFMQWNIAADYVINQILIDDGIKLPSSVLCNPEYKGMTAEQVYAKLTEAPQEDPGEEEGPGNGQGQPRASQPTSVVLDAADAPEASKEEWEQAVVQSLKVAEEAGNCPAGVKAAVGEQIRPPIPWREYLRAFMTAVSRDDYSYARFNRRYLSQGLYMPDAFSEAAGTVVVAIDTSGSVNRPLLDTFIAELKSIFNEVSYEELHLVFCSMKVRETMSFLSDEPVELGDFTSGGGTQFAPVFDWVRENSAPPDMLIYFTDMMSRDRPEDPGYPVIWAVPGGVGRHRYAWKAPFGEAIELAA